MKFRSEHKRKVDKAALKAQNSESTGTEKSPNRNISAQYESLLTDS